MKTIAMAVLMTLATGLLATDCRAGQQQSAGVEQPMADYQKIIGRLSGEDADERADYGRLRALYPRIHGKDRKLSGQLLSFPDTMFGRYDDAAAHYLDSYPDGLRPIDCPATTAAPQAALAAIGKAARGARVVMINESHSFTATRELVYRVLPQLRREGYDQLALEALYAGDQARPSDWKAGYKVADAGLIKRGYPLDDRHAGSYLSEPVEAEIIREALRLKFELVTYDVGDKFDERETTQANALAALLKSKPHSRLAVIAGYSHIEKRGGWMADRLRKLVDGKIVSIDQVAGLGGCSRPARGAAAIGGPFVLFGRDGRAWSKDPDAVDMTVVQIRDPLRDSSRSATTGWLTLGQKRVAVKLSASACQHRRPCFVEAFYPDESLQAVPADRMALIDGSEQPTLYLEPGRTYHVTFESDGKRSAVDLPVPDRSSATSAR